MATLGDEQLQCRRDHRGAADRLCAARGDEDAEARRQRAGQRGGCEGEYPEPPGGDRAAAADDHSGGQRDEREHEVERRQHPGDVGDVRTKLAQDAGQAERHDRRVGQDDRDRQRDERGSRAAMRVVRTAWR